LCFVKLSGLCAFSCAAINFFVRSRLWAAKFRPLTADYFIGDDPKLLDFIARQTLSPSRHPRTADEILLTDGGAKCALADGAGFVDTAPHRMG
jgi:hypothetical protein